MLKINIHTMTSADFESTKPFSTSKITKKLCEHQIKRELIYNHSPFLFHKHKIYCRHQTDKRSDMVPVELLSLKEQICHDCKDNQGNHFLNDLQLHKTERTSILHETQSVCRDHQTILKEGNCPREGNDTYKRPVIRDMFLLQFQMAIPGKRHENI